MKQSSLVAKAYQSLKRMIATNELLPGQQLVEMDLAERFSLSRTPIREAIRLLATDGLVEIRPNRGAYIKHHSPREVVDILATLQELEGLVAERIALQVTASSLSLADFALLESILNEMEQASAQRDSTMWYESDIRFHTSLAELCDNSITRELVIRLQTQLSCLTWFTILHNVDPNFSNEEHRLLLQLLYQGDYRQARNLCIHHRLRLMTCIRQKYLDFPNK